MRDLAARDQLLHAELHRALERDGGRHGDHGAGPRGHGAAHGELDGEDGVGVAVRDAVGAAVERADVVDGDARADEVGLTRRAVVERAGSRVVERAVRGEG